MKVDDIMASTVRSHRPKNPIGTQWAFCTQDGEVEFEVIGTREPYKTSCRLKSPSPDGLPLRFTISVEDWLDFIIDGRVVFKGEAA